MDGYLRFNRKSVDDRQIDTLIGLSKGLLADGVLTQPEVEFLQTWLVQARHATENPLIVNLLAKVNEVLSDGVVDDEEAADLMAILHKLNGATTGLGELTRSTSLPVNDPLPDVAFAGKSFLFTGTCAYGTRRECQQATERLGGKVEGSVNKRLHYLVLGMYVTDSWIHETFGRKIEKAMEYRDAHRLPLAIITEKHWASSGQLIPLA